MNKSITARLREASAKCGAVCPLPAPDIHGALDAIICLKDLTNQIKIGRLTDELGHDFQMNDAYLRAVELLVGIEGEEI